MTERNPRITLNNGVEMPVLGLGVYRSSPEDTADAVQTAIAEGYRLIDTAAAYGNEEQVGEGIRRSGVPRSEILVTTKLWITDYGYDEALRAFDRSMSKLGFDTLDLYLLHQPVPMHFERTIAAYKAAETLLADGRVRAIGVSNFSEQHLTDLMEQTDVVPAVNQVEVHPFFTQKELRHFHESHGITTEAWSPIGGVNRYWRDNAEKLDDPLKHPRIVEIAEKYGKTPAQVMLRWHIQNGVVAIPKSVNPERIAENSNIWDLKLSTDEMAAIEALDTGIRGGPEPDTIAP